MKKKYFFFIIFFIFINLLIIPARSEELFDLGKDIFLNKAACAACHVLSDAESSGMIGPNLNEIRPGKDRILSAVTNGIGVMPAYEGQLTKQEIEAVAEYVSIAANK